MTWYYSLKFLIIDRFIQKNCKPRNTTDEQKHLHEHVVQELLRISVWGHAYFCLSPCFIREQMGVEKHSQLDELLFS